MRDNDLRRVTSWTPEEEATAINLYEQGVRAADILDTLDRLYGKNRTVDALRKRMYEKRIVWGCRASEVDGADVARIRTQMRRVTSSSYARAERTGVELRAPWHPLRDNARLLAFLNKALGENDGTQDHQRRRAAG